MPLLVAVFVLVAATQSGSIGLTREKCAGEVLVAEVGGARVVGTCSDSNTGTRLDMKVTNVAEPAHLQSLSIGFCGPDIERALAPAGWEAYARGDQRTSLVLSSVSGAAGLAQGATLDGFVVYLKHGWRRSSYASAVWERSGAGGSGSGGGMSHDCP